MSSISSGQTIIYVPFKYNSNNTGIVFFYNNFTNDIDLSYVSELVDKNIPNSISHSTLSTLHRPIDIISGFYKYNLKDFTGSIRSFSLSNNFLWEYGFEKGDKLFEKKITSSKYINPTGVTSEIKSNSLGSNTIKANSCIEWYLVTYYSNNVQVWTYVGTTCDANCAQSISISQDSLRIKSNCFGSGGGSGGANQTSNITINLTDPCLKQLVQKLSGNGALSNEISDILQNVFNKNNSVNISFIQNNYINDGYGHPDFGQTTHLSDFNNIQVTLNPKALTNSSMEFKTQVIMHEILHGYLINYYNEQQTSNTDNSALLNSYVKKMAKSLNAVYPQMSPEACLSLSLKGLEAERDFEKVVNGFGLSTDNTKSNGWWVAGSFYYDLDSDKGTPCKTNNPTN